MSKILTPMRLFAIATLTPVGLIGAAAIFGGFWALASLIYLTTITAVLDEAVKRVIPPTVDCEFPASTPLCVVLGIAHFGILALVVNALANAEFSILTKLALFVAAGLFFGQVSNSNAHELIHRGGRSLHRLGKWVYISLLFGHHTSAHVLVHHRYVATPEDPSTSRRGESCYRFAARAWRGSFRKGFAAEAVRLDRVNGPAYENPYFVYMTGAAGFIAASWLIGGPVGAVIYIGLATFSTFQLLLSDYVQHYGLMRRVIDGKYEPVGPQHSWNSPHWYSSAAMLNAPRHSNHHAHPSRHFDTLVIEDGSPMLPRSLPVMACLALSPKHWRRVMDPRAAKWSA